MPHCSPSGYATDCVSETVTEKKLRKIEKYLRISQVNFSSDCLKSNTVC